MTPSPSRAEVLAFLGVAPGMRVADMFSASGYYTELLARTVGVKGQVIAYNNPPYAKFAEKGIATRYADGRLGNVRQITAEVGDLQLAPASIDAALFVMSYHDAYWRPEDGSWNKTDPAELLKRLFAGLKPGGVVVVQDHVASAGGDVAKVVDTLHRIDPALREAGLCQGRVRLRRREQGAGAPGRRPHQARVRRGHPRQDGPVHLPLPQADPLRCRRAAVAARQAGCNGTDGIRSG